MNDPTAGEELNFQVEAIDAETAVIAVTGELDGATAPLLKGCIEEAIEGGRRRIVVDLTATAVVDSICMAVLIAAWLRLRNGGWLAVAAGERGAGRTLRTAGVDLTIPVFADRDEALVAMPRGNGSPAA